MAEWISAYLTKLATSLLVSRTNALIVTLWKREFRPLRGYGRRLEKRLVEMPFLYRGMSLSSKDDYIEPLVATVTDGIIRAKGNPSLSYRTPFLRFKEGRKAIIFGEGGYGKTTLFRHLSIRCLEAGNSNSFWNDESLVPVFVQLKTVRPSSDHPVLDAILACDPYFDGKQGLQRLRRLAKKRRLMIFLDGYDEMPYVGSDLPHFRQELETLLGEHNPRAPTFFEANKNGELYKDLQKCRVYLSTRREFYFYSQLAAGSSTQQWILKGLGDRRIELVDRIFNHYQDGWSGPELDSELFLQQLNKSGDKELLGLSRSPLFLTVMCFVYASDLRSDGDTTIFGSGAFSLIKRCLDLLLHDLDEGKTKEFSHSKKVAYMNRRAAFVSEKTEFLRWFSARLYSEAVGPFSRSFVDRCANVYFSSVSSSPDRAVISSGLSSGDPTSNIVDQIVFSGVFVVIDKTAGEYIYDFPHRNFREALAVAWFDDDRRSDELKRRFEDLAYAELILSFVANSGKGEELVRHLIEHVCGTRSEDTSDSAVLLSQCMAKLTLGAARESFVRLIERESITEMKLPYALLDFVPQDHGFLAFATERLRSALRSDNPAAVGFWLEVVSMSEHADPESIAALVKKSYQGSFEVLRVVFYSRLFGDEIADSLLCDLFLRESVRGARLPEAILDVRMRYEVGRPQRSQRMTIDKLSSFLREVGVTDKTLEVEVDAKRARVPAIPWRRAKAGV